MVLISDKLPYTVDECRRCKEKKAKGMRWLEDDAVYVFQCDCCGKKMWMGDSITSNEGAIEAKNEREKAEENRDRYGREKHEQMTQNWNTADENLEAMPDPIANFYDSMEPSFEEKEQLASRKREQRKRGDIEDKNWRNPQS